MRIRHAHPERNRFLARRLLPCMRLSQKERKYPLLAASCVFAILAGLLHVLIFVLESFRWTNPKTMKTFSITSAQEAEATKEMAYNQGFYNLFLAIMALAGPCLSCSAGTPKA